MARIIETTMLPILTSYIQTIKTDNSVEELVVKKDDIVTDLRYVEDSDIQKVTGRVSNFNYKVIPVVRNYKSISNIKSHFNDDVVMESIDVDASKQYHSNVITVPSIEIVENEKTTDVKRMKVEMKYGVKFRVELSDNTVNEFELHEGTDVKNLTFLNLYRGVEETISGRLVVIQYRQNKSLTPTDFVFIVDGKIKTINGKLIKSVGEVVNPISTTESINDVITKSTDGFVSLSDGEFNQPITVNKDVTIVGARCGVPASNLSSRDDNDGETIISGAITVESGKSLTIDGCTITKNAFLKTAGASNVSIKNCRILGLTPTQAKSYVIQTTGDDAAKVEITGCYFGFNHPVDGKSYYNLFELAGKLKDGSTISNNVFEEGCIQHNDINIYNVEDNAVITIENNIWEKSANAIRIGVKGEPKCTFNINNNSYYRTDDENPEYAGLLLIQPYGVSTKSMAGVTINLNNTQHKDPYQIYYLYAGEKDMQFTDTNVPTIIMDGKTVLTVK